MSETEKTTGSVKILKAQKATDAIKLDRQEKEIQKLNAEVKQLQQFNNKLTNILEDKMKAETIGTITALSSYTENELAEKDIEELQAIEEAISKGKGVDASYKSIRAGSTSARQGMLTVGNLKGKTRQEILEMEGEF